jgi:hypothetical protein
MPPSSALRARHIDILGRHAVTTPRVHPVDLAHHAIRATRCVAHRMAGDSSYLSQWVRSRPQLSCSCIRTDATFGLPPLGVVTTTAHAIFYDCAIPGVLGWVDADPGRVAPRLLMGLGDSLRKQRALNS